MKEECKQCAKIQCPMHPNYEGKQKPKCNCEACWEVWNNIQEKKKINLQIIAAVKKWQSDESIHPLTCGNDSDHELLEAFEDEDGKIKLRCPNCDYIQDWVPPIVMEI